MPSRWAQPITMPSRRFGGDAVDLDSFLLHVVDAGLAGCILVIPWFLGGRHAAGQLVLVALAATVATAWACRQWLRSEASWRPTWGSLLLLAGAVLLILQLTPLPRSLLQTIAPHTLDLLPLWNPQAPLGTHLGTWNRISLTPTETRAAMMLFFSYGILFLVTVQRIERIDDVERLLRWCALSALAAAVYGLVQGFVGNGKYFWFHEAPFISTSGPIKGSFTNRNHFCHYLALGVGPLVWWLYTALHQPRRKRHERFAGSSPSQGSDPSHAYLRIAAVGIVLFAGLLSLSRGGNSVLFLAATVSTVVACRAAAVRGPFIAGLAIVGILIAVALSLFGYERVTGRLSDLSSGSLERLDDQQGRRTIWKTVVRAVPDFAMVGSGAGSHREVHSMYLESRRGPHEYSHAENGPLQVALETGGAGTALLLCGIVMCGFWCAAGLRGSCSTRLTVALGAITASLIVSLLHSLVDFVWYVPACTAVVAVLAGCACRAWQLVREANGHACPTRPISRQWAAAVTLSVFLVGSAMIHNRIGPAIAQIHWDRYIIALDAAGATDEADVSAIVDGPSRSPADLIVVTERRMATLHEVARWQPDHARARLALAQHHLRLFDLQQATAPNPMSLPNVRDAAIQSQSHFPTRQARDEWMRRAFGDHCAHLDAALGHARAALALCPLQGKAYLYLAELFFLDGASGAVKEAYIDQALRVRPFDAQVLYAAANEAWREGQPEQWLNYAQRAFRADRMFQNRLIDDLIGHTASPGIGAMTEFIVAEFQPDLGALRHLLDTCKKHAPTAQLLGLRKHCARVAADVATTASGETAFRHWLFARQLHREMGDNNAALQCARAAYQSLPGNYSARSLLAVSLVEAGMCVEAQQHIQWCLRRRPDDKAMEQWYRRALAKRLDSQASQTR